MDLTTYLDEKREKVNLSLEQILPVQAHGLAGHLDAMRYSLLAGGKRIRPILCIATAEAVCPGCDTDDIAMPFAMALECIHTYSLIHDDLPAMDDDDLRRGKPTNHKKFGEAAAILAGDSLLTMAFEIMAAASGPLPPPESRLKIIALVARAAGPLGMAGGQVMDLDAEGKSITMETLQQIHSRKTGALCTAAVQAGCLAAGGNSGQLAALTSYGEQIGLAFQIVDDLLDVTGTTEALGKTAGADASRKKATYPALIGIEGAQKRAGQAVENALAALNDFSEHADPLREIARYIEKRSH